MESKKMYRVSEVAEMLGVSKVTVLRWVREGKIRAVRLPSGQIRIPSEEVERIVKQTTTINTP